MKYLRSEHCLMTLEICVKQTVNRILPKKTDRKWREMQLFCDKIKNKGELDYEKMEITRREKESFKTIL